ncbi:MAG: hypothetical protein M3N29_00895 [Chloroflexota bacterium]|nr:hypothetical protein [Chloroflexota bacterium]
MNRWLVHSLIALALTAPLAGCVAGVPGASPSHSPASQPPASSGTPVATVGPSPSPSPSPAAPTASPTPSPSPAPTGTPAAVVSCPPATDDPAVPLDALLTAADGSLVPGELGSYDFCGTSADAQPPAAVSLPLLTLVTGETNVTVSLEGGTGFVGWRAGYADADRDAGTETSLGSADYTAPVGSATLAGPPPGEWLLRVTFDFGQEVGTALYYWRVAVP